MNPNSLYPRTSGAPSAFTPVNRRSQSPAQVAPISFNAGMPVRSQPASIAIISSGEWPFDQATLEAPHMRPQAPFAALYCDQLPGNTSTERGLALLDEVVRRRASGEFGPQTLVVLMLHGAIENGELMIGDTQASIFLPATVLLNALASGSRLNDDSLPVAPILLSACHAEGIAGALGRLERPVVINGGRDPLLPADAQAVLQACVRHADACWREGRAVQAASLFETLSSVSAETLYLSDDDGLTEHRLLQSSSSLRHIHPLQAGLHVQTMLDHGSADELAESLLLFGLHAYRKFSPAIPPLHCVVNGCAEELMEKVQLLLAIGVDVNEADPDGDTALHLVCTEDPQWAEYDVAPEEELILRHNLARRLLENGADADVENNDSYSPADLADDIGRPLSELFLMDPPVEVKSQQRTQELIARARHDGWTSVVSLLNNPQLAMGTGGYESHSSDDDTSDDETSDAATSDAATPDRINNRQQPMEIDGDTSDATAPDQMSEKSDS